METEEDKKNNVPSVNETETTQLNIYVHRGRELNDASLPRRTAKPVFASPLSCNDLFSGDIMLVINALSIWLLRSKVHRKEFRRKAPGAA